MLVSHSSVNYYILSCLEKCLTAICNIAKLKDSTHGPMTSL